MYNISQRLANIIRNGITSTNSKIEVGGNFLDDNDIYSFEIEDEIGIEGEPSIGSAVSKVMKLEIVNESATMVLTGNAIKVSLGYNLDETEEEITQGSEAEYIPLGTFYADPGTVQYGEDRVTVDCYDKMYYWDNMHYATLLSYPASTHDMLVETSTLTGVPIENLNQITETSWLSKPAKSIRQILSAIAELEGKQAIITRDGKIAFVQNHVPFNICIKGKTLAGKSVASSGNINIYVMNEGVTGNRNLILNSSFLGKTGSGIYSFSGNEVTFSSQSLGNINGVNFSLNISDFVKNARGKSVAISMEYKIDSPITYGTTAPWIGCEFTVVRNSTTGGVSQWLPWYGNKNFPTAITDGWVKYTQIVSISDFDIISCGINIYMRDAKGVVKFRNPKIEIGTTATPWLPALEDANITDYCKKYTLTGLPSLYATGTVFDYIQRDSNGIWMFYHNCSLVNGIVIPLTIPYSEELSQANQNVLNSITASPGNRIFVTSDVDPDFFTNVDLYTFNSDDYNQNGFTVTDECSITKLINHLPVEEKEEDEPVEEEETEEESPEEDNLDIEYGTSEGKSLTIENENIRTLERLQNVYNKCFPLTWRGFELRLCYGLPYIDVGDIISVTDILGNTYNLPVMSHVFRYDGGSSSEMLASIGEEDNTVSYSEDYSQKIINTERNVGKIKNQILGINSNIDGVRTRVTTVEQSVEGISQTVEDKYEALYQAIDASGTYSIKIESDSSYAVKQDHTYNLSCFVYRINENITSDLEASQFRWFRVSTDEISDLHWNAVGHIGSHLTVGYDDINEDGCVFYCEVAIYSGKNMGLTDRIGNRLCYRDGSPILIKELVCLLKTGIPMQSSSDNYKATFDMLKDKILLLLDHNGKLVCINMQSGDSTLIQLLADMISLEGLVTANEYFKILLDGSIETSKITVKDKDGASVITPDGLKLCFVYESSGSLGGFQDIGLKDYGFGWQDVDAIMTAFVPAGITITTATLKTIIVSRHITDPGGTGYATPGYYSPKQLKLSYSTDTYPKAICECPLGSEYTMSIADGTEFSSFGTWSPTASVTPQTKETDVTEIVESGKYTAFGLHSNKTYATKDEFYNGGLCKMVLVVEGYKKG